MTASTAPGDDLTVGTDGINFRLADTDIAVLDVTIPPGGGPPMLHRHDPFELYLVRRGELAIYLEGRDGAVTRRAAGPGTAVPIGGGIEHTVRNESDRDAEAVVVFSPGEPMERFARAAAEADTEAEVIALAAAHGIEITRSIDEALDDHSSRGYLTIAHFSGDGERLLEQYRKYADVMSGVGRDHGLILHAGAKTGDGFMVINLWPSRDGSEAAARDPRRLAVIERAGIDPSDVRREHHEVAHFAFFD